MKASPAFQFYAQDFLVGTADMSAEEVGGYIRLLCYQWTKGGVPDDDAKLAMLTHCSGNAVASIRHKFGICHDGQLRNERLETVRAEQDAFRQKQAEKARNRWSGNAAASPQQIRGSAEAKPGVCSSSSSSISNLGEASPAPRKRRVERNALIDALASVDGSKPEQITAVAWPGIGKALADIKAVSPDVTPEEIRRRAENYRLHHREATISAHALAKHWGKCGQPPLMGVGVPAVPERVPANLRENYDELFPPVDPATQK